MKLIPVSKNKYAKVDDQDFEFLSSWSWNEANTGYPQIQLTMHRLLLHPPKGMVIDHIDGDPLNNQRSNLRICTVRQNAQNTRKKSGTRFPYKGVALDHKAKPHYKNKYRAQINNNGKSIYLGTFPTPEIAALAYDLWANFFHGEFANTNFQKAI